MKGKITEFGCFDIERAGKLKPQYCPYTSWDAEPSNSCGDWCPLFGEPEAPEAYSKNWTLTVSCGSGITYVFDEFTDERTK